MLVCIICLYHILLSYRLVVVAQKVGSKTPGPPSVSEREKSPDNVAEKQKFPCILAPITICHALPEEAPVTGVSFEDPEMETSPTSAPISAMAEKDASLPNDVPGTVLQHSVILPRACRPQLVWGLLPSHLHSCTWGWTATQAPGLLWERLDVHTPGHA